MAIIERPRCCLSQLEICCRTRSRAEQLVAEFGGRVELLPHDWRAHFARAAKIKPLSIGRRLVILNSGGVRREMARKQQSWPQLIIPAAAAFGTGEHVTTAMCLRLLEKISRQWAPEWSMLDAGTGSGILALAAWYFGARNVIAIDYDPRAVSTAKHNARLNKIRGVRFKIADALKPKIRRKFDVITANLYSELLIKALPMFAKYLKADGHVIASGVLREQERAVVRALLDHDFLIQDIRRRGKWVALCAQKRHKRPVCVDRFARRKLTLLYI
ncbi:MAG: 50S ribosomal protein L11 methyltransferase [Verrucomicrobiota bacterium]|nr:50S ribosomal protein L11 methyltransferase [Verrucomicrobiota bacterium]